MKRKLFICIICLGLGVGIFLNWQLAVATLGKSAESTASDRKAFSAVQRNSIRHNGYTVQEFESKANIVREYVSPCGVVFAVAWSGLSHPDLTSLLGSCDEEYLQALPHSSREHGQRNFLVKANRVIVEKWGYVRSVQGRAYVPALVPSGVSIDEVS